MDIQKAILEFLVATLPAVVLYFLGWAYLYFFLISFGINIAEVHIDTPTIFIYSFSPLQVVFKRYGLCLLLILFLLAVLYFVLVRIFPRLAKASRRLSAWLAKTGTVLRICLTLAVLLLLALLSAPVVSWAADQASARIWTGKGANAVAITAKKGSRTFGALRAMYNKCGADQSLILVYADDKAHYLLCKSSVDDTQGVVFEVRRELGLVSVRFVSGGRGS